MLHEARWRAQFVHQLLSIVATHVAYDHAGAFSCGLTRDLRPDSAGGAGHQHDAAVQPLVPVLQEFLRMIPPS